METGRPEDGKMTEFAGSAAIFALRDDEGWLKEANRTKANGGDGGGQAERRSPASIFSADHSLKS